MSVARYGRLVDLDEQIAEIQRALVDFDSGIRSNVAVIGEPLAGKSSILDAVIARYGKQVRKVKLTEIANEADRLPALIGKEKITAVDDCQYLFLRRIGGFDALESFLDVLASSDRLSLTSWNMFAWNYLEQVFALSDYFPVTVTIPPMGTDRIAAMIGARYELDKVRYADEGDDNNLIDKIKQGVARPGKVLTTGKQDLQSLAFSKIADESHGNPGVALALWQKAYRDGVVRLSEIEVPDIEPDLSPDEAFVISNILMMKSVSTDDLMKVTMGHLRVDRILYKLLNKGLISKTEGRFSIEPLAMHDLIKSLKKSRQVW